MIIRRVRGEPLAGTRKWIEKHDLEYDPTTRDRILHALRAAPGSAIFKDGLCIYPGVDKHFSTHHSPAVDSRGRTLENRVTRRRSRSFSPDRRDRLSRSPFRNDTRLVRRGERYDPEPRYVGSSSWRYSPAPRYDGPPTYQSRSEYRYRSPPPYRRRAPSPWDERGRSPSPYRRARSPEYISGGVAAVYNAKDSLPEIDPLAQTVGSFPFDIPYTDGRKAPRYSASTNEPPARITLDDESNIDRTIRACKPILNAQQSEVTVSPVQAPWRSPITVEDPYFVLGVGEDAKENEITEAFQQRVYEIESERISDDTYAEEGQISVWDESMDILKAARRQVLGY